MSEHKKFRSKCNREIKKQGKNKYFKLITKKWMRESLKTNYSYHFEWLGRPIIQYPQDIVAMQNLIWTVKPDLIIETGIARGGSIIFYASILKLISLNIKIRSPKVLGVDIDIRKHNKKSILSHPMSKYIEMIEGSSTNKSIFEKIKKRSKKAKKILVILDSKHTHDHVLEEIKLYAPLVSKGSYIVVFDTIIDELPNKYNKTRPWSKGNSPKTAVFEYLKSLKNEKYYDLKGNKLNFKIDNYYENQNLITVAPSGFLKRI